MSTACTSYGGTTALDWQLWGEGVEIVAPMPQTLDILLKEIFLNNGLAIFCIPLE